MSQATHSYFCPAGYKFRASRKPLKFNNSLEQLTELSESDVYLQLEFYYKGCNSGIAKWKRYIGWGLEGHTSFLPSPLLLESRQTHEFTNLEVPPSLVAWSFYGVLLHRHCWLNHWPLDWTQSPAPLSSPEWSRDESSNLLITCLIFLEWLVCPLKLKAHHESLHYHKLR